MSTIYSGDRTIESSVLADHAARAATGFASLGVGYGDTVALLMRNDFPFLEASIAAGMVGAYSVPVNWHYTEPEARYLFEDSGAKVIVVHADLLGPIANAIPAGVTVLVASTPPEIQTAYGIAADKTAVAGNAQDWEAWLQQFPPATRPIGLSPGAILYTSGTTGRPKGVQRAAPTASQSAAITAIVDRVFGFADRGETAENIVAAVVGPMYHSAPNGYGLYTTRIGANVVLEPKFDAETLLKTIEKHRVTHVHLVPIMFNRLLKLPEDVRNRYDLSSLKFVAHAAAPVSPSVKRQMIDWWGPIINEYYGATETGVVVFCDSKEWLEHPGTVGKPIPGAEVRIIDEDGNGLGVGEIGDVAARNLSIADFTYRGDAEKRRQREKSGLITPGDVGYLDADGYLYLCDRSIDMIISGGVNIYPTEIEAELQKMPGIADCAVFGIPDEEFGESICAVVLVQTGQSVTGDEVRSYLRSKLAGYKVPKRVDFADELPREDSGKIFKRKLREPYWEGRDRRIN